MHRKSMQFGRAPNGAQPETVQNISYFAPKYSWENRNPNIQVLNPDSPIQ